MPDEFISHTFPLVLKLALTSQESEILQNSQECLKLYVQKGYTQLMAWKNNEGQTGIDLILRFVSTLLDPSQSESSALFVGNLIIKLIQKGGDSLVPILPEILRAITIRLESATSPSFIQSLIEVFAHLIIGQIDAVIDLLVATNVNNRNGLEILLTAWCDNYGTFHGYFPLKVSAVAMSKIFLKCDPRINQIEVKGDIIVSSSDRIVTRSRSKLNPNQYAIVNIPIKIVKLLISDLESDYEMVYGKMGLEENMLKDAESDSESGLWEDIDEDPFAPAEDYKYLTDLIDNEFVDVDEEEDDADIINDPIYELNLKNYLIDFFTNCATHNINQFSTIFASLTPKEQQSLRKIIPTL